MTDGISVLLVSKGHDFNHDAFLAMFDDMEGVEVTLVQQPAAQVLLRPENIADYDAVLFYDMSGIPGVGLTHDRASPDGQPTDDYRRSIEALLERGTGIVMLNHATVSWPEWPLWRQMTGSSFMLKSGTLNGAQVPGSGYRGGHGPLPNATVKLNPVSSHAVLEGLENGFEITDELYIKMPDFEADVEPLLRADYEFVAENFTPPPLAPADEQAGWDHPQGQQPDRLGQRGGRQSHRRLRRGRQSGRVREFRFSIAAAQRVALGGVGRGQGVGKGARRIGTCRAGARRAAPLIPA